MLDVIIPFALGALSGMGVGGGGLFMIYLVFLKGAQPLPARAENIAFFLAAASAALPLHASRERPDGALVLSLALAGVAGSIPGAALSEALSGDAIRKIFGAALVISAAFTVVKTVKASRGG